LQRLVDILKAFGNKGSELPEQLCMKDILSNAKHQRIAPIPIAVLPSSSPSSSPEILSAAMVLDLTNMVLDV
jgi:hypothetical protein